MELIMKAKSAYIAVSVIMLILGFILIISPEMSLSVLCFTVGLVLLLFGVVKLVGYFSKDLYRLAFQFDLALGIFMLIFGGLLVIRPFEGAVAVTILLGVTLMVDGAQNLCVVLYTVKTSKQHRIKRDDR